MKVLEIAFTGYCVTNMKRAREFYEGVLGLVQSRMFGSPGGSFEWVEYDIGAGTLALILGDGKDWQPSPLGTASALEVDDFEAFGWQDDHSAEYGAGIPIFVGLGGHTVFHTDGVKRQFRFDPTARFHHYTTVIGPGASGKTRAEEYIDGVYRWSVEVSTPSISVWQHLILSYALREYPERVLPEDTTFAARSVAVYEDGAHAGQFVTGGGVAPGTVVK